MFVLMILIVPVKQKTNLFNPDEIRATEISFGKRDKIRAFRKDRWKREDRFAKKRGDKKALR
jgi:hypothetical protein